MMVGGCEVEEGTIVWLVAASRVLSIKARKKTVHFMIRLHGVLLWVRVELLSFSFLYAAFHGWARLFA